MITSFRPKHPMICQSVEETGYTRISTTKRRMGGYGHMPLKPEIFSSQNNKCSEKMIMGNMKVNNKSVNMSAKMEKDITNAIRLG